MTDAEGEMILNDRIMKIQSVIEKYGPEKFSLNFSGGKDSTVLSYLLDEALPGNKITRVFVNTGIEMKAIVDFVKEIAERERDSLLSRRTAIYAKC